VNNTFTKPKIDKKLITFGSEINASSDLNENNRKIPAL
jgi:hypothetical protein